MVSLYNNLRMNRSLFPLDGNAKSLVHLTGPNGTSYATALKILKHYFGNPITVVHLPMIFLFEFSFIKAKDKLNCSMALIDML